jgi:transposase-like protein
MAAKMLEATKAAVREYRKGKNVALLARKHGIARNTLWRAIKLREQSKGRRTKLRRN